MELKTLREKIVTQNSTYSYGSLDELILDIVNTYAVEMCEEQRRLCAENAEMEEIEGADDSWKEIISKDSILDAPLPYELD